MATGVLQRRRWGEDVEDSAEERQRQTRPDLCSLKTSESAACGFAGNYLGSSALS